MKIATYLVPIVEVISIAMETGCLPAKLRAVGAVFAAFMFHLQIVSVEEDYLASSFGKPYLEYKKKVCRYLGRRL